MNNQDLDTAAAEELKNQIDLGDALARLEVNPDFIAVIKEAYIMQTLVLDSQWMLDPNPPVRQEALEKIMGVNYLRQKLTEIKNGADGARQDVGEN